MGKFDRVPELVGTENYYDWRRQTENLLLGDGVYNHVSNGTNPNDWVTYGSHMPRPRFPGSPTSAERELIIEWSKNDGAAKSIILRKVSSTVISLIPDDVAITARQVWQTLLNLYERSDISLQYSIRNQIGALRMKGASDAEKYVAAHTAANERLARMGARPSNSDALYALLRGLPTSGLWPMIRKNIEMEIQRNSQQLQLYAAQSASFMPIPMAHIGPGSTSLPNVSTPYRTRKTSNNPFLSPPPLQYVVHPYGFQDAATTIISEAAQMLNEGRSPGPGSEYANLSVPSRSEGHSDAGTGSINPETGLRRTKNNPSGTYCTTPACVPKRRSDHDGAHCYNEGGGMEGQAPWQREKGKEKWKEGAKGKEKGTEGEQKEVAQIAASSAPEEPKGSAASRSTPGAVAALASDTSPHNQSSHFRDLSCASIVPVGEKAGTCTILDSGTTSHLICDRSLFWTFTPDTVKITTANLGTLHAAGRGDCMAVLTVSGRSVRIRLKDCLYAPGAISNLLSAGRMANKGWEVRLKGNPDRCELLFNGESLGCIPMVNYLCFLDVAFERPIVSGAAAAPGSDISCFAPAAQTWDLWHARFGHLGGDVSRLLPASTQGIKVGSPCPQTRCESCIVAKHPCDPHPTSASPPSSEFLELVHSDICGPFPTLTIHGKRYFILFLDDFTNALNVQLLATRNQAFAAWRIIQARWENKYGKRVRALQTDNGGEYISAEFESSLREQGIEHRKSISYIHQQNGKAERAVRTIEGRALAALSQARLSAGYFGEAVLLVRYLWNLSVSHMLPSGKTPFELLHGYKPDVSHLRVFSSQCFARIPPEVRVKNGPHSREAIFLGYPDGVKGWRLRDVSTGSFFNSRDVVFDVVLSQLS